MKRINSCFEMRVLFLLLLFSFALGFPTIATLEYKLPERRFKIIEPRYLEDSNREFWIVIYKDHGSWLIELNPFETMDEALFFANHIGDRFVSIRHVEPAMKLHLNVTKVRRVVEEEIRKWVK